MLKKIRAWLDRRTKGSTDPGKIDSARQDAMAGLGAKCRRPTTSRLSTKAARGTKHLAG